MNAIVSYFCASVDVLRAQFRELSLVENDLKRDLAWAQQNFDGVRELKKEIQQQIFTSAAVADQPLQQAQHPGETPALTGAASNDLSATAYRGLKAVNTTSHHGQNSTGLPRP